jgi:hypothetical protein
LPNVAAQKVRKAARPGEHGHPRRPAFKEAAERFCVLRGQSEGTLPRRQRLPGRACERHHDPRRGWWFIAIVSERDKARRTGTSSSDRAIRCISSRTTSRPAAGPFRDHAGAITPGHDAWTLLSRRTDRPHSVRDALERLVDRRRADAVRRVQRTRGIRSAYLWSGSDP